MAKLVLPAIPFLVSYIEALREGHYCGNQPTCTENEIQLIQKDPEVHFVEQNDQDSFVRLSSGELIKKVSYNLFWLVDGNDFIGSTSVRYELNDFLRNHAGHIGYGIRPSRKMQGYGKMILKLSLQELRKRGLKKALVTANESNIASWRAIEANGGILEKKVPDTFKTGTLSRHYWIDINAVEA